MKLDLKFLIMKLHYMFENQFEGKNGRGLQINKKKVHVLLTFFDGCSHTKKRRTCYLAKKKKRNETKPKTYNLRLWARENGII